MGYALESGSTDAHNHQEIVVAEDALDSFSRLRVSNPDTIFDSTFRYNAQPLIYSTSTANGGQVAHTPAASSCTLSLDGTPSGSAILQSKRYMTYIPGKSQLIVMTGVFGDAVSGVTKRAGYFDGNNGIYFEQAGDGTLSWCVRTDTGGSPSDARKVTQDEWNLDTLDGTDGTASTNPSRITLNGAKAQILIIDLQWLGMGRVRVGFDIGGAVVYCHEFLWANTTNATTVYMRTANLPVRWEISGDAAASMLATCASVQAEGGSDKFNGYSFAYNRAVISAGSGTQTYAFSIRPKATFNSITTRFNIRIDGFDLAVTGNSPVLCEVYYDTTVGGTPSWTDMDATYSGLQVDTAGTPSGGVKVMSFVVPASATNKLATTRTFDGRYPLFLDIAGTGYTNITVYVTGLGGASNCYPGVSWEEVR